MAQKDKVALLLDFLKQERTSYITWIQRKEIAVWSAIIFYIAILWTLFSTFIKDNKEISILSESIYIFIILILAKIFFHFIHSQFSSIYHSTCRSEAMFKIVQKILNQSDFIDTLDFSIYKDNFYPVYIQNEIDELWPKVQPFRGRMHPLRILLIFWFRWFYKKSTRKLMSNYHKQEASIYSLILFTNGIFIFYILYLYTLNI